MTIVSLGAAVVGGLLLFFLPGYALTRSLFPEWRLRGPDGPRHALETVTLAFVTSVGLTVLVGFGILDLAPGGFSAAWSDPLLEGCLAAVAAVAFVVALLRGAWSRVPLPERVPSPPNGEEGAWEISRELERLDGEERRLRHALRVAPASSSESARFAAELELVRTEREELRRKREEEYVS